MTAFQRAIILALCAAAGVFGILSLSRKKPHFCVIIPTYNNEKWAIKNLQSVVEQTYQDWNAIIVDDISTDATGELLDRYVRDNNLAHKVTIVHNTERKKALRNIYEAVHSCPDKAVVVTLDGDDWFATPRALERIAREYTEQNAWITYGQYIDHPRGTLGCCRPFPSHVIQHRSFRKNAWCASHPRTFYVWLFKKIKKEDLMIDGEFFSVTWDLAFMYPMLEMASRGHIRPISDVLYVYNHHENNDYVSRFPLMKKYEEIIRNMPVYEPVNS